MSEPNDTTPETGAIHPAFVSVQAGPATVADTSRDLPVRPPDQLIGRSDERAQLNQLLQEQKAVLLTGVDGIGKTALAATIAAEWIRLRGKSVLWVNADADDLAGLCDRVARAYGELDVPYLLDVRAKTDIIRDILIDQEPLVVLDNLCNPKAARDFVRWCTGGLGVLATGRALISTFTPFRVEPLRRTDARALFCHYAGVDIPPPGDQLRALDALCEGVGDHPYALELAGRLAAVYDLPAQEILAQYQAATQDAREFADLLPPDEGDGRAPIAPVLHASLKRLKPDAQAAFTALGAAYDRGATAELLAPVAGLDAAACEDALRDLAQLSIAGVARAADGMRRYAVKPLIYAYARAIQSKKDALAEAEHRMLASCHEYAERYGAGYANLTAQTHAKLDMALGNLLGAAAWAAAHGEHETVNRFAHALFSASAFLDAHDYVGQALALLPMAVEAARQSAQPAQECARLIDLGRLYLELGLPEPALSHHQQALERAQAAALPAVEGEARRALGSFYLQTGALPAAVAHYGQALELARDADDGPDKAALGLALTNLGTAFALAGELERAVSYHEKALRISRDLENAPLTGANLANLGSLYRKLEQPEKALECCVEAVKIARIAGDPAVTSSRLLGLGHVHRDLDESDAAAGAYNEALALARQTHAYHVESESLGSLGRLHAPDQALEYYAQALEIAEDLDDAPQIGNWRFALGASYMALERWEEAITHLEAAHAIRAAQRDPRAAHTEEQLQTARKKAGR
ncbi:MAG: tetratricopeptide repeat protein [Anaerolineae bacterium]|nr:tetratricopeptide repeat protein [Anaerolineae bacterium]